MSDLTEKLSRRAGLASLETLQPQLLCFWGSAHPAQPGQLQQVLAGLLFCNTLLVVKTRFHHSINQTIQANKPESRSCLDAFNLGPRFSL